MSHAELLRIIIIAPSGLFFLSRLCRPLCWTVGHLRTLLSCSVVIVSFFTAAHRDRRAPHALIAARPRPSCCRAGRIIYLLLSQQPTTLCDFSPRRVLLKNLGSDVASNTTLATTLLSYHIVPGAAAFSTSLKNGQNLETGLSARGSPVPPLKVLRPPPPPTIVARR